MKVVVFGSTGPTGLLIVKGALDAGHQVRAFARTPSKVTIQHESLDVFRGDVYDESSVSAAVKGMDAVVCTVGVPYTFKKVTIYSVASRSIAKAMKEHRVSRLVGITSGGTHPGRDPKNPFFFERILKPLFHTLYDDMREMEEIVAKTELDWTILRPPRLMDRAPTGVRLGIEEYSNANGSEVSRADLATFAVEQLTARDLIGKCVALSN